MSDAELHPELRAIARFRIKAKKASLGTDRRALNEATDMIESLRDRVTQTGKMLTHAICPMCRNEGQTPYIDSEGIPALVPCPWCKRREKLLSKHQRGA